MSNSVRPHRRQPTRLRRPWDSPGKNTGVGCHFLLQCMKVKSEREAAQSCLTLRDPMDCSLPGSSVHRISQARVLQWGAIAFSTSKHTSSPIFSINLWWYSFTRWPFKKKFFNLPVKQAQWGKKTTFRSQQQNIYALVWGKTKIKSSWHIQEK